MKTITLQGTDNQLKNLDILQFNYGNNDRLPQEVKTRVYVVNNIDSIGLMSDILTDNKHYSDLTDEEFMMLAKEDGRVYTLQGFQEAFNLEEVNSAIDVIRFISVPIS